MIIECMEPLSRADVISDDGFLHQIKWDGIRGVVHIGGGRMAIYTRSGHDCMAAYPELSGLPGSVGSGQAVLDGELVVFADGKPSFYHVLQRSRTKNSGKQRQLAALSSRAVYRLRCAVSGRRRSAAAAVDRKAGAADRSLLHQARRQRLPTASTTARALFALMKQRNMEGIVSKRRTSAYTTGKKHSDWYKTKTAKKMLCVITGVKTKNGVPASLTLGVWRDGDTGAGGARIVGCEAEAILLRLQ